MMAPELTTELKSAIIERYPDRPELVEWVPYDDHYWKQFYDVKLHDGTVVENLWPNAGSFHGGKHDIPGSEVAEVRWSWDAGPDFYDKQDHDDWYLHFDGRRARRPNGRRGGDAEREPEEVLRDWLCRFNTRASNLTRGLCNSIVSRMPDKYRSALLSTPDCRMDDEPSESYLIRVQLRRAAHQRLSI